MTEGEYHTMLGEKKLVINLNMLCGLSYLKIDTCKNPGRKYPP